MWNPECLNCSSADEFVQCPEVDAFVDGALVVCPYSTYGCDTTTVYSQARQHKRTCVFAPCPCLVAGCSVRTAVQNLRFHLAEENSWRVDTIPGYRKTTYVKFRRTEQQVLLVIEGDPSRVFRLSVREREKQLLPSIWRATAWLGSIYQGRNASLGLPTLARLKTSRVGIAR